jgi:hypothetical protein
MTRKRETHTMRSLLTFLSFLSGVEEVREQGGNEAQGS